MKKIIVLLILFIFLNTLSVGAIDYKEPLNTTIYLKGHNLELFKVIEIIQRSFPLTINFKNLNNEKKDFNLENVALKKFFDNITKAKELDYTIIDNNIYVDKRENIENIIERYKRTLDAKYVLLNRLNDREIEQAIKKEDLDISFEYVSERIFVLKGKNEDLENITKTLKGLDYLKQENSKFQYLPVKNIKQAKEYLSNNYPEIKILKTQGEHLVIKATEKEKEEILKKINSN